MKQHYAARLEATRRYQEGQDPVQIEARRAEKRRLKQERRTVVVRLLDVPDPHVFVEHPVGVRIRPGSDRRVDRRRVGGGGPSGRVVEPDAVRDQGVEVRPLLVPLVQDVESSGVPDERDEQARGRPGLR